MVPRIHERGCSIKGCALYLLRDKGADTNERVEWAVTRNLATDDCELGWRLMAATAMDRDRLKQQAGIKNSGRKSDLVAQHISLSWHEDDSHDLDQEAMLMAAEGAIAALGASDRQCLIVCHNDEPHGHVHILLNRVSPEDGRMLSTSKEKLALSAWAEQYEKDRGRIWCDERVVNNEARRRGEYVRGTPAKARNIYEAELRRSGNDNASKKTRDTQRQKDADLARREREQQQRQVEAWASIERSHKQRIDEIKRGTVQAIGRGRDQVRQDFRPRWKELHHEQQADMRGFEQRESTLLGRIHNRFKSIDLGAIIGSQAKGRAIGEAFGAMASQAARLEVEKKKQREEEERLHDEQKKAELALEKQHRQDEVQRLEANRQRYQAERMELILSQRMDEARMRAEWDTRSRERKEAFQRHEHQAQPPPPETPQVSKPPLRQEPSQVQQPYAPEQDKRPDQAVKGSDMLPKEGADEAARLANEFMERMRQRDLERQQQRDQDRDRGDRDR